MPSHRKSHRECKKHCKCKSPDFIVVGLGTAGAVLARYLSDNNSVAAFEAGLNLATDPVVLSSDFNVATSTWPDPKYSQDPPNTYGEINAPLIPSPYSLGRMWGGSSAHNAMLTVRGSTDLWDDFAAASGNNQWKYENVLPIMKFLESYTPNGSPANYNQRGQNGPWYIKQEAPVASVNTSTFSTTYSSVLGVPLVDDYNDPTNGGTYTAPNYLNVGISVNQLSATSTEPSVRSFSVNSFLPQSIVDYTTGKGLNGRKLQIFSSATVTKVLFHGNKAIGVQYIIDGNKEKVQTMYAKKRIILCAGAIYDVAILQRSGVGDATLLNSLGIPVVVNSPNVGANLQNHFGPVALVKTPANALPPFVLSHSFFGISDPSLREIEVFFQRGTLLFPNLELARNLGVPVGPFGNVVSLPFQLVKNNSKGDIKIVSTDPLTDPRINFKYYVGSDDPNTPGTDAYNAVQCLRKIEAFNNIPGFSVAYPTPADYAGTDTQLYNNVVRNTVLVQAHASTSCRMGTDITNGVVDGDGNVFGTRNLMIADLSICSRISTGGTQYAPYVLALRIAKNLGANLPF